MRRFSRELFICKFPEGLLKLEHTHYNLGCLASIKRQRTTHKHSHTVYSTKFDFFHLADNFTRSSWLGTWHAERFHRLAATRGPAGCCLLMQKPFRPFPRLLYGCANSRRRPQVPGTGNNIPKWYGNIISAVTRSVATGVPRAKGSEAAGVFAGNSPVEWRRKWTGENLAH